MLYPGCQEDERERVWLPVLYFPGSQMGLLGLATGDMYLTNKAKSGGISFAFEVQCEVCHVSV